MASSKNVHVIEKDADFDGAVLKSDVPVLVEFAATWAGPCKALAPIIGQIADNFQGRVKVVTVDIDDCTETTKKYGAKSVPTVMVFKGGEKKGQIAGLTNREKLIELLGV